MKRIISFFQTISIYLGVLVIILFLIPMVIGVKPFVVLSGSMEPNIKTGSVAYVNTHVNVSDIKEGDIIGFNINNSQVTHRVVKINENRTFTTKGDANLVEDSIQIRFDNYIGKTIFSIPYIGKIIVQAKSKIGVFIILSIVSLNIFFMFFDKYIFDNKKVE